MVEAACWRCQGAEVIVVIQLLLLGHREVGLQWLQLGRLLHLLLLAKLMVLACGGGGGGGQRISGAIELDFNAAT